MAIFVDGENCAKVPGTDNAVSVNSVNQGTSSEYVVNNSVGASGYNTSMDGVTKSFTCEVPVTPGEPVEIEFAIADTSDGLYDSAIALVDGGIYSK